MKFAIIIPASMESERLPGKPLLPIGTFTMLQKTIIAARYTEVEKIVVASSSMAVEDDCSGHTNHFFSKQSHLSGTSRCAEALAGVDSSIELVVNWQVDEPFLDPKHVDRLVEMVSSWTDEQRATTIGTIVAPPGGDLCPHCSFGMKQRQNSISACPDCFGGHSKHIVKAACSVGGKCRWFSRAPMLGAYNHVGVYCYHRSLLEKLPAYRGPVHAENLEQLDWLIAGYEIQALVIDKAPLSINTMWDYERAIREGQVL